MEQDLKVVSNYCYENEKLSEFLQKYSVDILIS